MQHERDLAAEVAEPKYAQFERERRWLAEPAARPALDGVEGILIEDRYLDDCRFRLRRMSRQSDGWNSYKLTKKYHAEDPAIRPIVTAYLTHDEHRLFRQMPGADIAKRRYRLPLDGLVWSLDIFEGSLAGLELVETEAADNSSLRALMPPPWALNEITNDERYQCGTLARTQKIPE